MNSDAKDMETYLGSQEFQRFLERQLEFFDEMLSKSEEAVQPGHPPAEFPAFVPRAEAAAKAPARSTLARGGGLLPDCGSNARGVSIRFRVAC